MSVAPPAPRLPALSRLHAVAMAHQHGGYAAAAAALGVSPGAIRARVRGVEAALDVGLFDARSQGLEPTEAGRMLGHDLVQGFAALSAALAPLGTAPLPLNAVIPTETALRLNGIAAAARELGLTPSAVSEQVQRFEAWTGQPVFTRHARGVVATDRARRLLPGLSNALDRLRQAVERAGTPVVRIAALPAIAQLWLAPRLPALRAVLPGVTVSITALEQMPRAKHAPYDMAVFALPGGGRLLTRDALLPVCAPSLAAQVTTAADLLALPCLGDAVWYDDWAIWAQAHGLTPPRPVLHSLYVLSVAEAVAGAGVLMGHSALVARHLATGALVAPLDTAVPLPRAVRLVPLRRLQGDAARVAAWLAQSATQIDTEGVGGGGKGAYIAPKWRDA